MAHRSDEEIEAMLNEWQEQQISAGVIDLILDEQYEPIERDECGDVLISLPVSLMISKNIGAKNHSGREKNDK